MGTDLISPLSGVRDKLVMKYFAGDVPDDCTKESCIADAENALQIALPVATKLLLKAELESKKSVVLHDASSDERNYLANTNGYYASTSCGEGSKDLSVEFPPYTGKLEVARVNNTADIRTSPNVQVDTKNGRSSNVKSFQQ